MKGHADSIRGFHWTEKAWYADSMDQNTLKKISFGMYCEEGGTTGEMSMQWETLAGCEVPRLKCYDDGWSALSLFADLLFKLAEHDGANITRATFVGLLLSCGFKDLTNYECTDKVSD